MIGFLGKLGSFLLWLLKRFVVKRGQPSSQYERAKDENAKIIETGNADALNAGLDSDLDRLPDK